MDGLSPPSDNSSASWRTRNRATGFEPGHRGLGHARPLRQCGLAQAVLFPEFTHSPTQLVRQPRDVIDLGCTWFSRPSAGPAAPASHPAATSQSLLAVLVHRVLLGDAPSQRPPRPIDLLGLPHPGLGEYRQQDNPPPRRDPIGHPHRSAAQVEPQLPQLALKLTRVRLAQ